uniref:G_PROTEIN_RECEP_F1_2 domain-containing protein n=1 Tax=Heterorhabditis bacteriophora TaxID=37862 RepID=A0A1I7WMB5_HETBA
MNEGKLKSEWTEVKDIVPYLEKGDLIEFKRVWDLGIIKQHIYSHWALFIGHLEGLPRIVHFASQDDDFKGSEGYAKLSEMIMKIKCSYFEGLKGSYKLFGNTTNIKDDNGVEVRCDSLYEVAGNDLVRVNIEQDAHGKPFPPSIVIERALLKLGSGDYNLLFNNCEHFVLWCRYGYKFSKQIIWCLLYAVIALFAVVGNSLVIYVTIIKLRPRSITTYFIINLGFADLLTGVFAIPFKFQAALFQEWFLPHSLCQIVPYAETVSLSVSVFTLTASAMHEFRTVFFSKQGRLNCSNARSLVLLIWAVAAVVSLPHGLFHKVYAIKEPNNVTIMQCRPVYAEESWWKIYNIYLTIIHYFVPMLILDTAYTMIAFKNKYKREYRRVFAWMRCRSQPEPLGELRKFDTEYSPESEIYQPSSPIRMDP